MNLPADLLKPLLIIAGLGIVLLVAKLLSRPSRSFQPHASARSSPQSSVLTDKYRTNDGSADYEFSFEQQPDGNWRIYVTNQPGYSGRDEGLATHRLLDGNRQYICWKSGSLPLGSLPTLPEAKEVAAIWADKTQEYIRTGIGF